MAMAADLDDRGLYEHACALLATGKLPSGEPSEIWGGAGRGEHCCVCLKLVQREEIAFDLSFRTPESDVELHMHSRCRIAWERAREYSRGST
jgi:hypothetical protein